MIKYFCAWIVAMGIMGCTNVKIDNINTPPKAIEADTVFANVYHPLDGTWQGQFKIYEDKDRGVKKAGALDRIGVENLRKFTLQHVNTIEVTQLYQSESPYFQTVEITDIYEEANGQRKEVHSKGVNKVQDGKMWCVVRKPDETVIHEGSLEGQKTIVWQRNEQAPQKIEYFKETVADNTYEIIGYGYYEGDDPTLMPRLWFYGRYDRVIGKE